jgi:hypothetical protein
MKINNGDIFSWSNCNDVKIGQMGYFAFDIEELNDKVENTEPMELVDIDSKSGTPFQAYEDEKIEYYPFFLPFEKVENYRPFKNLLEFYKVALNPNYEEPLIDDEEGLKAIIEYLIVGQVIRIKRIGSDEYIPRSHLITCASYKDNSIYLSDDYCTLKYLLEHYKLYKNGEWVPFGVEKE